MEASSQATVGKRANRASTRRTAKACRFASVGTTSNAGAESHVPASLARRAESRCARNASATSTGLPTARSRTRIGGLSCLHSGRGGRLEVGTERLRDFCTSNVTALLPASPYLDHPPVIPSARQRKKTSSRSRFRVTLAARLGSDVSRCPNSFGHAFGREGSASGPLSKKVRKEQENVGCMGSMRSTVRRSVSLVPGLRRVESAVSAAFETFVKAEPNAYPKAKEVAAQFGQKEFEVANLPSTTPWRRRPVRAAGLQAVALSVRGRHLGRLAVSRRRPGDVHRRLGTARSSDGIEVPIECPAIEEEEEEYSTPDVEEACCTGVKNYTSFYDEFEEAKKELEW